jgi:hypothetical protein
VEEIAREYGVGITQIGVTFKDRLQITNRGSTLIDSEVRTLKNAWEMALERMLHA